MSGLGRHFWEKIEQKFIAPLYDERNKNVPKKIQDYLEKILKGKIINADSGWNKPVENAKVKSVTVTYRRPETGDSLPSNINYDVVINTDQGDVKMLARNWEDNIEIIG